VADDCDVVVATTSVTDVTISVYGSYNVVPAFTFTAAPGGGITATGTPIYYTDSVSGRNIVTGISITNPGSGYLVAPTLTWTVGDNLFPTTATSVLGEKRHCMDIVLRQGATHKANIDTLRQHFRCDFVERKGKIAFVYDKAKASTYTFNKDNAKAIGLSSKGTSAVPTASVLTFTNPKKDWVEDYVYAYTDNVKFGVDEYRPSEWTLAGVTRANEATRNNAYLLGRQRRVLGATVELQTADGHQLERGDRVTIIFDVLGMSGGGVDFLLDTVKDSGDGKFLCTVSYYNAGIYADTVGVVESHVILPRADPFAQLAAPTSLVLTEIVDEFVPGNFLAKLRVGFTPAFGPYYGGTQISYNTNGGTQVYLPIVVNGPVDIPIPNGLAVTVNVSLTTVNYLNGLAGASTLTGSHVMYNPNAPEAIDLVIYDNNGGLYWNKPKVRTYPVFGAGSWAIGGGFTGTLSLINNGNIADNALQIPALTNGYDPVTQPTGAYIEITTGGATFNEFTVSWFDDLSVAGTNEILMRPLYFNGTTWVEPTGWTFYRLSNTQTLYSIGTVVGTPTKYRLCPNAQVPAATVARIAEIQPVTFGATYPYVKGYLLTGYDINGNLWQKLIDYTPTITNPINTGEWTWTQYAYYPIYNLTLPGPIQTLLKVQTVSPTNDLSVFRRFANSRTVSATGTPAATTLGPNSELSADPPAGDNTQKIATTAWGKANQSVTGPFGVNVATPGLKFEVKGSVGAPAGSGTTQTGIARFSQAAGTGVLDLGFWGTATGGAWLQATNSVALGTYFDLLLNPLGGNVGFGTISPATKVDVVGTVRSTAEAAPTSGAGVEVTYNAGSGYVRAYDRSGSVQKPLVINDTLTVASNGDVSTAGKMSHGDLTIGSGTAIKKHLSATLGWTPGTVNTGSIRSVTVTVTGAVVGDTVAVGFSQTIGTCQITGAVTSANTVTVVISNLTGSNFTPSSGTVRVDVWQH
jgi:hypothetical protein